MTTNSKENQRNAIAGRIKELNQSIRRQESEKKPKYELDEPVRFTVDRRTFRAFIIKGGSNIDSRICYDITLLEPVYPGSAVMHSFKNVPESQLKK